MSSHQLASEKYEKWWCNRMNRFIAKIYFAPVKST